MTKSDRPNMLVMWGNDIGISNLSYYSDGQMGILQPCDRGTALEGASAGALDLRSRPGRDARLLTRLPPHNELPESQYMALYFA
jgi:hypothetical protein